jgi:predicted RecB family nuclease
MLPMGEALEDRVENAGSTFIQKAIIDIKNVVAIETPVSMVDGTMVGHMDIVAVDRGTDGASRITIADFKTERENEFVHFIPQVDAYSRMLASQLDIAEGRIECVIFGEDASWRFSPGMIKGYVESHPEKTKPAPDGNGDA